MLSGDNGILQRSADAKERTGIAEVVESAKLDILEQIADNKGENISKEQLKDILNKYFEGISTLELPDDLSNSDIKLNANQTYGGYKNIALSDIYIGSFIAKSNNFVADRTGLKLGDYVNYVYDSTISTYSLAGTVSGYASSNNYSEYGSTSTLKDQTIRRPSTALQWRILSINEDGSVDLISTDANGKGMGSIDKIIFQGSLGYNNSVYILNEIAKEFYSNSNLEGKAMVRSINIEDIEKHFTKISEKETDSEKQLTGEYARNNCKINGVQYGGEGATVSGGNNFYPKLYAHEKFSGITNTDQVAQSNQYYSTPTSDTYDRGDFTETLTFYYFSNTPVSYIQNKVFSTQLDDIGQSENIAHSLLFSTTSKFWLASRYVSLRCTRH